MNTDLRQRRGLKLTCQGEHEPQNDDQLDQDGGPLKAVHLPACGHSGEARRGRPSWRCMPVTRLLQEPQAKHLNDPSDEDQTHKWGDGCDVLSRQRHLAEGVQSRSKGIKRCLRKAQPLTSGAFRCTKFVKALHNRHAQRRTGVDQIKIPATDQMRHFTHDRARRWGKRVRNTTAALDCAYLEPV